MKSKFGTFFMVIGALLLAAALALFVYNQQEQEEAGAFVDELMPQIVSSIQTRQEERTTVSEDGSVLVDETLPVSITELVNKEMTVVEIDGYGYIGFVTIPSLGLDLPVMSDWSYSQLKIAPCRYTGGSYSDDLVIMAHNYNRHFGQIKNLQPGDTVIFTDMDGEMVEYEVVALDILNPTDVEAMIAGDYDLTLFTCTYGGRTRVTVRCDRVAE